MIFFEEKFNNFYPILENIAKRYSVATGVPLDELKSSLSEEFYLKYKSFDSKRRNNFQAYMRVVLTQRAQREVERREGKFYKNVTTASQMVEDDDEADFFEMIPDEFDLEEYIISREEIKTDADKRQLINALTENSDPVTKRIVTEVLSGTEARPTAIGRALGIHHQTVIRKLKYLSKKFDETLYGEIDSYLVCS